MRVSPRHLELITGKASPPPPNPLLARLNRLEALLTNRPAPQINRVESVSYDDSAIMARLDRIEKLVEARPKEVSASYKFEVNRDMNGKILDVVCEKVPASSSRTLYSKVTK